MFLDEFYIVRLEYYGKRKAFIIRSLKRELEILENKLRFILAVTAEPPEIKINKTKKKDKLSFDYLKINQSEIIDFNDITQLKLLKNKDFRNLMHI